MLRRVLLAAAFVLPLFVSSVAWADPRAELDKARASFLARNWSDAEERLRALIQSGVRDRAILSPARMYLGAIVLGQGKVAEAKEIFENLIADDDGFEPDPLSFPPEAVNAFYDARSGALEESRRRREKAAKEAADRRLREESEREAREAWRKRVELQAAEERVTVRHSRVIASLPFGAGQLQNGQVALGFVFLGLEVAALGGTAITFGMYNYARSRESEERDGFVRLSPQWHARAEDIRIVNLAFVGGFLATAAIGIAQANVAFVPEGSEKRKRDLPPLVLPSAPKAASAIAPILAPLTGERGAPNGMFVGLSGALF